VPESDPETLHGAESDDSESSDSSIYKPNHVLGGRYRVISVLGKGGMGIVYRVEQVFLEKELALKTIDKKLLSDLTLRRFQHEARATFAVDHPNIVSVHDYGILDDQTPFLAMELVFGKTLADVLKTKTRLSVEEAIPLFVQVCFGLAHAHKTGIVHRDIKPSNIMLIDGVEQGTEGSIKILDFGIAKFTQHEAGEIQALTKTGEIFGSPLYMSPEQCAGTRVDLRSDVYSLGCVLYEALTGTPPFAGETALATMLMHQSETVLPLKEASLGEKFPPELEKIVQVMLAKKPEERYQSLGVAANDLAALARGEASAISVVGAARKGTSSSKPEPTVTLTKTSLVLQMLGIAVVSAVVSSLITNGLQFESKEAPPDLSSSLIKLADNMFPAPTAKYVLGKPEQLRVDLKEIDDHTSTEMTIKDAREQLRNPNLRQVRLRDSVISRGVLEFLTQYPQLEGLDFMDCALSNEDLGILAKLPIARMSVIASNFNDVGAEQISKVSTMDTIKASSTALTDKGVKHFAKLKKLRQLKIENTDVSAKTIALLCQNPSFKKVFLARCTKITAEDQRWLMNTFPSVNFDFKDE
jgi:serine/threonine protein kinase